MPLPTQKTTPSTTLQDYTILMHGPPKIGKTSLMAEFPNAIFLTTEPGVNALSVYNCPIQSYDDFFAAVMELEKGDHPYETVVIDTVDNLFDMFEAKVCDKNGVDHIGDIKGFCKGSDMATNQFKRALNKLAAMPYGLVLLSHSRDVKKKSRTGDYLKTVPTIRDSNQNSPMVYLEGMVDMILYIDIDDIDESRRVIHTKPHKTYMAGDRTRLLPEFIDMGKTSKEAYNNFVSAFTAAEPQEKK